MSNAPPPTDPVAYDAPPETQAALAELARRIATLERERRRIRREDWETLFRQIQTLAGQLATHPFLRGDLEAELRVERMLTAADLEAFDRRVDDLAEYIEGKLAFNAAMDAADKGAPAPEASRPRPAGGLAAAGVARRAAINGPSGSDFDLGPGPAGGGEPPRRRGVIRL